MRNGMTLGGSSLGLGEPMDPISTSRTPAPFANSWTWPTFSIAMFRCIRTAVAHYMSRLLDFYAITKRWRVSKPSEEARTQTFRIMSHPSQSLGREEHLAQRWRPASWAPRSRLIDYWLTIGTYPTNTWKILHSRYKDLLAVSWTIWSNRDDRGVEAIVSLGSCAIQSGGAGRLAVESGKQHDIQHPQIRTQIVLPPKRSSTRTIITLAAHSTSSKVDTSQLLVQEFNKIINVLNATIRSTA